MSLETFTDYPAYILDRQKSWRRKMAMYRMRQSGATYREIAKQFGLSKHIANIYVRQMATGRISPCEKYVMMTRGFTPRDNEFRENMRVLPRKAKCMAAINYLANGQIRDWWRL